jgi:hypothetical protein
MESFFSSVKTERTSAKPIAPGTRLEQTCSTTSSGFVAMRINCTNLATLLMRVLAFLTVVVGPVRTVVTVSPSLITSIVYVIMCW